MNYFKEDCPNCGEALSGKETESAYKQDEGLIGYCPKCLLPVPVAKTTELPEPEPEPTAPEPEPEPAPEPEPTAPEPEP